jgi:hypothetical protein
MIDVFAVFVMHEMSEAAGVVALSNSWGKEI